MTAPESPATSHAIPLVALVLPPVVILAVLAWIVVRVEGQARDAGDRLDHLQANLDQLASCKPDPPAAPRFDETKLLDRFAAFQKKAESVAAPSLPPRDATPKFTFASIAVRPVVINLDMVDGKPRTDAKPETLARIRADIGTVAPGLVSLLERGKAFKATLRPEEKGEKPEAAEAVLTGELYEAYYSSIGKTMFLKVSLIEARSRFPVFSKQSASRLPVTDSLDEVELRNWLAKSVTELAAELMPFAAEKGK